MEGTKAETNTNEVKENCITNEINGKEVKKVIFFKP